MINDTNSKNEEEVVVFHRIRKRWRTNASIIMFNRLMKNNIESGQLLGEGVNLKHATVRRRMFDIEGHPFEKANKNSIVDWK